MGTTSANALFVGVIASLGAAMIPSPFNFIIEFQAAWLRAYGSAPIALTLPIKLFESVVESALSTIPDRNRAKEMGAITIGTPSGMLLVAKEGATRSGVKRLDS